MAAYRVFEEFVVLGIMASCDTDGTAFCSKLRASSASTAKDSKTFPFFERQIKSLELGRAKRCHGNWNAWARKRKLRTLCYACPPVTSPYEDPSVVGANLLHDSRYGIAGR
jgi:hypothetical protein